MTEDNLGSFKLSDGAIKFLETQTIPQGAKKGIDVDFTFQIERATKNNSGIYNCTLIDNDSKYGGFLVTYDPNDGIPGVGDIIHVSKILIAILPSRDSHVYFCKNVKIIRRAMALQVDPKKLNNVSKKKSLENYKNSVYKASDNDSADMMNNIPSSGSFDDSTCTLISALTTFITNPHLYLKCKVKNPLRNFVAKATKKDCTLQSYIFTDTKGDEIQATAFNKAAENFNKVIQEGGIYEMRKVNIQLADRAFNNTRCDYKLVFNEPSQIIPVPDNGKFNGVKFAIIPLEQIIDFPIGKIIDIFGFVLEDKGFQEITTKSEKVLKMQKLTIGDDTLSKIELTFWEPLASQDVSYSSGDIIAVKNCRVREYNGRKTLSSIDSTEVKRSLDKESDARMRKFYDAHRDEKEYKEIQGESFINTTSVKSPAELVFIQDIQNTYDIDMDNKDRPVFEINATVTKMNHSERNFYKGCAKCHRKMEGDVCNSCSSGEKKTILSFSLNVRDASGLLWIDLFGDIGEKFLGMKGEEYENLIKSEINAEDNEGLKAINEKIEYRTFSFIGKVRESVFNETKRHRFSVFRFAEINIDRRKNMAKTLSNLLK